MRNREGRKEGRKETKKATTDPTSRGKKATTTKKADAQQRLLAVIYHLVWQFQLHSRGMSPQS